MIQEQIINKFKKTAFENNGVLAAILYGSFARKTANLNSDIDIAIFINKYFNKDEFIKNLSETFKEFDVFKILYVELRNKFVIYFKDIPKFEIAIISELVELERNYLGSKIPTDFIKKSVLFDKTDIVNKALFHFNKSEGVDVKMQIENLISKFVYEFESCSTSHSRSDGYQFYYFYNIAFHIATQLRYFASGKSQYYYLPKGMSFDVIKEEKERELFYKMSGSNYLPDANNKKRLLLDFFYSSLGKLKYNQLNEVKKTLEYFYKRDYFWNFRDLVKFNNKAKIHKIFRTSSLTAYQDKGNIKSYLIENKISTIIDLRAPQEIEKNKYNDEFIADYEYLKAPLDPWNQPKWFKDLDHTGKKDDEIAYHFFVVACKNEIKAIFQTLLNSEGAVAIHCHAGKDRTGLIIMLVNLLIGNEYQEILNDYLASEMDTVKSNFDIYYNIVKEEGGIKEYLISCGLTELEINEIKQKLSK